MLDRTRIVELEKLMRRIAQEAHSDMNAVQAGRTLERIHLVATLATSRGDSEYLLNDLLRQFGWDDQRDD